MKKTAILLGLVIAIIGCGELTMPDSTSDAGEDVKYVFIHHPCLEPDTTFIPVSQDSVAAASASPLAGADTTVAWLRVC